MMGLGYLGSSSSSSSSSNLSPLAPPFTVDRSNHNKPVLNPNPVPHFNDPSSYGVSSWPYSHSASARQELTADSPRTSSLPPHNCGYMVAEAVNLPTTGSWASSGKQGLEQISGGRSRWSGPKRVTDSLSYNPSEAKPYYASSVKKKNDDVPLVTFSEPSYDLLSTSGLVHGDEVDYTRSLSGLEYNPQLQDSVWSGLPEVKKMESDDIFFSEEAAYNSYLNQGPYSYGTETSSSKRKDDSSLFYYADIIRRANNTEPPSMDGNGNGKSVSKGGSTFRAFPMFSESHPLIQSAEPPEDVWNSHRSYNPIYEKRYHMFDDRMSTKSSSLVIKPPASKGLEIDNLSSLNISDVLVGAYKPLKEKDQSTSTPNQLSFQIGRSDESCSLLVASPSSTKQDNINEQLNFEFKARPSFQVPEISIPTVNTSTTTEDVKSSIDHHNPAEDSPCWKGAPTSHFLPFETTDSPQPPTKKLQTGQTDYSFHNSSGVHETTSGVGTVEVKASNGGGESVHDTFKPNKGHGESTATSDANSQTPPKPNLPEMMYGDGAKNVNASDVVKSLYNLSDLLLLHCSNDESALKEHDREALDHVIRNLGVCISRQKKPQQNTGASSNGQVMNETTSCTLQLHDDQKPKCDGENVEKLLEHASLSVVEPEGHNMVQAIKKVLDENVECNVELPSETLRYKNLWLEAEAELCSLSFRARFERLKRETDTHKSKSKSKSTDDVDVDDDASASVKEISSCINGSSKVAAAAGSGSTEIDDVEASVMARFNILKRRQDPNPVDVQVAATVLAKDNAVDVDPWVMDRLNILKRRGDLNTDAQEKQVRDCANMGPHFQDDEEEEEEEEEAMGSGGSDWEHILKDDFSWRLS